MGASPLDTLLRILDGRSELRILGANSGQCDVA